MSYTAPADGIYVFDTLESRIDTVLYTRRACDGPPLACNDDVADGESGSRLGLELAAGETVFLTVDGADAAGDFTLMVRAAPTEVCPNHDLGSAVPQWIGGRTVDARDDFAGRCGGLGSPDESMMFTVPRDGRYQFATFGSSYDTILSVRDGLCSGSELACNQDSILIGEASFLESTFTAGQQITVVVDGFAGDGGDYALRIEGDGGSTCPDSDLGSLVPTRAQVDTHGASNIRIGSCGGGGAPERAVRWTAPSSNAYRFSTSGSSFDPVIHVRRGACHGPELACSRAGAGGAEASVSAFVRGGDSVFVLVDGQGTQVGSTTLRVDPEPARCPHVDLGSDFPVTYRGSTRDQPNGGRGRCGGEDASERAHRWTAPHTGTFVIDTFTSAFDTVLHIRDGDCDGAELACNDDEDPASNLRSIATVDLSAGQAIVIFVDGYYVQAGDYALHVR